MDIKDIEFLKELKNEMLTQDKVCQADPRFWVVMQTVRDYWVEDDIEGIYIYDTEASESAFEGELENLAEWIKNEFDVVEKCEYDNGFLEIVCEDENEYFIDDVTEIRDFLEEYDSGRYSICNYRDREEIVKNTMFLTIRECKEHIEANSYHYNKPHTYAMTAWRSPQVEKLYKILKNTNWDELLESNK
ncbi:hypothetical protein GKZ28_00890 [Clostridium chromiireducens]|uniref:Uncharacterized protein n=1 Tax=Clostridium chromiireducens TaxID=225345 RepID=A0A964W068_9CLOT|nr:hypothetical protein [Clostridium chromiireducens]MVX62256.1 hypothetical protein [Clostridium chromiireducens]